MPQRARQVLTLALALAWGLLPVSPTAAQTTPASPPSLQQVDPDPNALKLRFGIEYWVRVSNIDNFDFDASLDDNLNFGWHRIKPFFGLRKRWFELVLQGQDARSHNVPEQNPNGTSNYALATSQLDFVKAFVTVRPKAGLTLKVGREQADGIDIGMSRKFASASDYATVLRSFDLASLRWDGRRSSVMGVVATPVDNEPYAFNQRRVGELFWALQGTIATRRNTHRLYLARRSTDSKGPTSETGVRGESDTYVLGFQELGPLFVPGLTWELDSIVEWGDRATDKVRAAAVFATATHAFNPDQSVFVGYHQGTGDGHRGGGTTHLYDTLYSSGFNNYGYMGLSQGRNIGDVRIGGRSKIKGPASLLWGYHEQFLSVRQDQWYAIFTPNIDRPGATSSLLGREIDATLLLRFPFARHMTIALGYLAFFPRGYLKGTGPHARAQQFAIDINGQF